jgi:hypothetical protein
MNRAWGYKKYNPFGFYIGGICELYSIAKAAQLLHSTPANFDKEMLQVLLCRYRVPLWIKSSDISLENLPPVVSGKEDIVNEVYSAMVKYNKKLRSSPSYFLKRLVRGVLRRIYRPLKKILIPVMRKLNEV